MPCPHTGSVRKVHVEELKMMAKGNCNDCDKKGPNLWACLQECCTYVGCGRCGKNHIDSHHKETDHHLCVCLRDFRVWCFSCESEVDPNKSFSSSSSPSSPEEKASPASENKPSVISEEPDFLESERGLKPRGLCGLMNIGNTCYMNSALQALSNCPPLTQHFLECRRCVTDAKHPGVSGNYSQLVNEMWSRKRAKYLVPSQLLRSVRAVNSQFRGYGQQDSQEFLRCIMDQMHEELKQPMVLLLPESESSDESEEPNHHAKRLLGGTNLPSRTPKEDSDIEMLSDTETVDSTSPLHAGYSEQQEGNGVNTVDPEDIQIEAVSDEEEPMVETTSEEEKALISDAMVEENHVDQKAQNPAELKNEAAPEISEGVECEANQPKRHSLKASQCDRVEVTPKKKKAVSSHSIITDLFDGKIQSSVQCLTCNRVSSRIETFQDLSLPIPGKDELSMIHASQCSPLMTCSALSDSREENGWVTSLWDWIRRWIFGPHVTLQDCLAAFFSADELKGDNMYSCEKCKKLRNGIKLCKVSQLPELLCIHLKRFRHEMYFSSKINHLVTFPLTGLDMKQFLVKDPKPDQTRCCTTYDLVSVITHHGSVGAGHYVAFANNYIDGKWYEFNDSWVTEVSDSYVSSVEAYVLFYRKVSEDAQRERQLFVNMTRNAEPNCVKYFVSKPWFTKFQTCAEPGPVTNTEFICSHGAVQPSKADRIKDLIMCVPETVWRHFQSRYGGGPAVSQLEVCEQCKRALEELERRRKFELETFKKLNNQFPVSNNVDEYCISMKWFRWWEVFVKGEEEDPPGPIDNNDILVIKGHVKMLRAGANPGQLSLEVWKFLHDIYDGGPVYMLEAEPEEQDL